MNKSQYIKDKIKKLPKKATLNNVSDLFQLLVRLNETNEDGIGYCVTCGKELNLGTTDCQAGHFIPRGIYKYRLSFENCHLQCSYCNKHLSGNVNSYTIFMQNYLGFERTKEMQEYYRAIKFGKQKQIKPRTKEITEKYDLFVYLLKEMI